MINLMVRLSSTPQKPTNKGKRNYGISQKFANIALVNTISSHLSQLLHRRRHHHHHHQNFLLLVSSRLQIQPASIQDLSEPVREGGH